MKEGMYVIDDCACEGGSLGPSYSCPERYGHKLCMT